MTASCSCCEDLDIIELVAVSKADWWPFSPKAVFAHIKSTPQSLVGIGTIGIDHNEFFANFFSESTKPDFPIFDVSIAAHTKNQVIAIHSIETIIFHNDTPKPQRLNWTVHHNISVVVSFFIISSKLSERMVVIKTVDKLIAKQMIAGEKIIGIRLLIWKFDKKPFQFFSNTLSQISLKAEANAIKGDIAIATQRIHTLRINTIATIISGILIANRYHRDSPTFNNCSNIHHPHPLERESSHAVINEEYKAQNTPTYDLSSIISLNLLVVSHPTCSPFDQYNQYFHIHSFLSSNQYFWSWVYASWKYHRTPHVLWASQISNILPSFIYPRISAVLSSVLIWLLLLLLLSWLSPLLLPFPQFHQAVVVVHLRLFISFSSVSLYCFWDSSHFICAPDLTYALSLSIYDPFGENQ